MPDVVIANRAIVATPNDYKIPGAQEILLKAVRATFSGGGSSSAYLPCLQLLAPDGTIMWTAFPSSTVAAGGSADVSWFPDVAMGATSSGSSDTGDIQSITSPTGTLTVASPTGPFTNVDMPTTGVGAGSYGDASHSAQITVDSRGRLTAAASVAISGGSGTIGFEIGYDQITSPVNIGSTTEATATTIITCSAHTFDGAAVLVTFFAPYIQNANTGADNVTVCLFESTTEITRLGFLSIGTPNQVAIGQTYVYRFTPTAASHTYLIKAFAGNLTGTPQIGAGTGSGANYPPAFVRFTKV